MVNALPFDFWIFTSSHDHNSDRPYENITPDEWVHRGENEHVYYCSSKHLNREVVNKALLSQSFDKLYFNSLFSKNFTLLPIVAAGKSGFQPDQIILAPRGMLKSGALSIKPLKKKLFLIYARLTGLFDGIIWHATSSDEQKEIVFQFGNKATIRIAENLPGKPISIPPRLRKKPNELRLVAMSRVSSEKNILGGIRILNQAAETGKIVWDIYGTLQNEEYHSLCTAEAQKNPLVQINFKGETPPEDLSAALSEHHFFFLPTLGENYGHAIAEAFLHGLPVIISDKTPWIKLAEISCGFDVSLEGEEMKNILLFCLKMEDTEHEKMCDAARKKGSEILKNTEAIARNLWLFQ